MADLTSSLRRSAFLGGSASAFAFFPARVRAQAPVPLKIGVFPSEVAAQTFYGVAGDFFKKAGIDAQLEFMDSGAAIAPAVVAGTLDIGISDYTSIIRAHARGLPFVYLVPGVITNTSAPGFAIVVGPNSPIHDAKDFNNKTIATNGIGNIGQLASSVWIDRNGGDWQSVKWIELPLASTLPAIAQGRIDGSPLAEPFLSVAREQGFRLIYPSQNPIAQYLGNGWFATGDWVRKNPEAARKFVATMREIGKWANTHKDAVVPILAKYTKQEPALLAKSQRYQFADAFTPSVVQALVDICVKYGVIGKSFAANELFPPPAAVQA